MQAQGLQYYDFSVAANQTKPLAAPGRYFRYYSGSAGGLDSTITLKSGSGAVMCLLKPGQSIRLPQSVTDWYIGNYANAATISGLVVVGDGELADTNIAGEVSIIDGGLARTLLGEAFLATIYSPATAAKYSHCQLFNPAGSGKNLIVEAVSFSCNAATNISQRFYHSALSTAAAAPVSKNSGGAAGVGLCKNEENAAILGASKSLFYSVLAGMVQTINFKEPVILGPEKGLMFCNENANSPLFVNYEFLEQSV